MLLLRHGCVAQRQQQQQQPSSRYLEPFRPARWIISANEKNGSVLSQLGMLDARPGTTVDRPEQTGDDVTAGITRRR